MKCEIYVIMHQNDFIKMDLLLKSSPSIAEIILKF